MTLALTTRGYICPQGRAAISPPAASGPLLASVTIVPEAPVHLIVQPITTPTMAPAPSSTVGGSGWVRIVDILAQDASPVSDKVYQDPGNTILQSATTATPAVQVSVEASYPLIVVNGADATLLKFGSFYAGTIDVTLAAGGGDIEIKVLTGDDEDGAVDTTAVTVEPAPEILTLSFTGVYPGSQTELKAGDTFQVVGTTDLPADAIDIQDFGAFTASLEVITLGTTFTVTGTVADRGTTPQALAAQVRARNAAGAFGTTRDTDELGGAVNGVDLVVLNNLSPTVTFGAITYPGAQQALKGSESAVVGVTTSDLDTIAYDSPGAEVSITNPTLDEPTKTVARIGGTYNVTTPNLRATANRTANNATTVSTTLVQIAQVAAQITVTEPTARLRSGGNDGTSIQDHIITLTSTQELLSAPSLSEDPGGGVFIGIWTGGPTVYTRTLQVHDDDTKATYTWQSLNATNLAGVVTSVITGDDQYTLGGLVPRNITFPAFSQNGTINVEVVNYSKVQAGIFTATNQPSNRNPAQGDTSDIVNTYTVLTLSTNPTTVFWNDQAAASSNSSGTAQLLVFEEVV